MSLPLEQPLVVATVTESEDLEFLDSKGVPTSIDVLEFRLDGLLRVEQSLLKRSIQSSAGVLLTARSQKEGGVHTYQDNKERVAQLLPLLGDADAIDLEVRLLARSKVLQDFVPEVKKAGACLVASFHDFEKMPRLETLKKAMERAKELGADVFKAAVVLDQMDQLFKLAGLLKDPPLPLSLMGMGPLGKLSRLVLARAGSVLNYGYLQKPNAPGQWSATELRRLIDETAL